MRSRMFLAALVSNALADEGIGFQVPWAQLIAFTVVAVIAVTFTWLLIYRTPFAELGLGEAGNFPGAIKTRLTRPSPVC